MHSKYTIAIKTEKKYLYNYFYFYLLIYFEFIVNLKLTTEKFPPINSQRNF